MAYDTVANVKDAVGYPSADATKDGIFQALLDDASQTIDEYCNRTFTTTTESRSYYATSSPILWVDDLVSISSLTVAPAGPASAYALSAVTDYEARPLNLTAAMPHYTKIARIVGASEIGWGSDGPRTKVTITGVWGYAATVPPNVVQVCQIMAARMWLRRVKQYANEGGQTADGTMFTSVPKKGMDEDCKQRLSTYIKRWHNANVSRL